MIAQPQMCIPQLSESHRIFHQLRHVAQPGIVPPNSPALMVSTLTNCHFQGVNRRKYANLDTMGPVSVSIKDTFVY